MCARSVLLSTAILLAAAACGTAVKPGNFDDDFGGTKFPDHGWLISGPAPILDMTSGDPASSLTWVTACTGSNGAVVQVDKIFDSAGSFDAQIDFLVYGTALSAQTGTAFHAYGDQGDDASVLLFPPPADEMKFELDGTLLGAPITLSQWHHLEFGVDHFGNAAWAFDNQIVLQIGPFASTEYVAEIDCGSGAGDTGPVPILFDNIAVHSHP